MFFSGHCYLCYRIIVETLFRKVLEIKNAKIAEFQVIRLNFIGYVALMLPELVTIVRLVTL